MSSSQIDDASPIMINFRLSIKKFKQGDCGIEEFELMVFCWYYVLLGFAIVHSSF